MHTLQIPKQQKFSSKLQNECLCGSCCDQELSHKTDLHQKNNDALRE